MTSGIDITAFERLASVVVVLEPEGTIVYWNSACSELTGYTLEDWRGRPFWDLLPSSDHVKRTREALQKLRVNASPDKLSCSWARLRNREDIRQIAFASSVILDHDGNVGRLVLSGVDVTDVLDDLLANTDRANPRAPTSPPLLNAEREGRYTVVLDAAGVVLDITDRKQASEEGRLSHARLDALSEVAADAIISIDSARKIAIFNEGAEAIFGWSAEDVLGQPVEVLLPERFREIHRRHIGRFAEDPARGRRMAERRSEIVGLRRNGEEFPAVAAISKIDVGGKQLFTVTLRDVTEKQTLEQERQRLLDEIDAERRRLRVLLDIVPLGVVVYAPDGRCHVNRQMEELFGKSLTPDGDGEQYSDHLLLPDGKPVPDGQLFPARVLRDGATVIGQELLIERPDGSRLPVLASAAPLRDVRGRVIGGVGALQDITDRKRAEDALDEERLKISMNTVPLVAWSQDTELRYTWVHNPAKSFPIPNVLGKTDFELFLPDEAAHLARIKRSVLEGGIGVRDLVHVTINSEPYSFDLTVEPQLDAKGRTIGVTCAIWDVTDPHRREQEQRFLAQVGKVLMNATPDHDDVLTALAELGVRELADWFVIDVVDARQVRRLKVAYSDRTKAGLGKALEELPFDRRGGHLTFHTLESRRSTLMTEVTPEFLETIAQDGEQLELLRALDVRSFIAVPLVARNRLLGAFALLSSSTSRRYRQRDLLFAEELARVAALAVDNAQLYRSTQQASAARDEVLGVVAHDLRNPLSTILMQVELLRRDAGPERRNQEPIEVIRRAGTRMSRLIQDMLDIARVEAGSLAVSRIAVSPRSLLEEAFEYQRPVIAKVGTRLRLDMLDSLPDVMVDRDRILQVFDNLIGNAAKFAPRGSEIVVRASRMTSSVLFSVTDTGAGIPRDQLPHLFDRFWQGAKTDRRSAGLGLFIVKGIIDAHDGLIWVDSQVGVGTTVCFTIPFEALHAEVTA